MSWEALFSLQGHSPYLLGAYGVTLALIGLEAALLWRRSRSRARRAAQQTARRADGAAS
ncbi:heme exporter protein CcmD [Achromobacter xylosoxidans A8]|uniref:Heme exporter protein D n=1 Tax=Achromobacter xylosoxidans (strain A8) TaxID=762376 RepID=E3HM65_ACHXA|nr:heme exporter protein CcmD [Achromobacter xylosoxidans]ADP15767.1 heme exporter protein CcmD [Achromobacter xylosoxidans A8]